MFSRPRLLRRFNCWNLLLSIVLALGLAGCGEKPQTAAAGGGEKGGGGGGKGGRGAGGPAPVIVEKVQRKAVPLVIDAIGIVEPMRSAAIRSQITGTLFKIDIKEGQDVKQGDLLFELDARPLRNSLEAAESDRKKILVQLENARAQVDRYKKLVADAMVSQEQFQKIQDDARALEAQALSSESTVANAKLQLDYCSIRAPITGRTGNLAVHEGDLVRANDVGVMVSINQISPIYVTFGVPQQHLAAITRYRAAGNLAVIVVPPGNDPIAEKGELTFIDNMVDSATGTLKLKGTFDNSDNRLWPGQFATVTMTLATPEAITVPSSAVQTSQTGQHVFVVGPDLKAEQRDIVVERTFENDAVVIKGLKEGETVVTDGQLRVIPGKPVEIKTPDVFAGGSTKAGKGEGKGGRKSKDGAKDVTDGKERKGKST
jgi:multidrug efflux system membrane fusion protein